MQKKILFISHNAGRTGAPLLLLNLLKWLNKNTDLTFEVLLLADGPLHLEFSKLAPVHIFPVKDYPPKEVPLSLTQKLGIAKPPVDNFTKWVNELKTNGISMIYANTVVTGKAIEALAPLDCPVITHIHELDYWIDLSGKENWQQIRSHTDCYIAASESVKNNLANKHSIPTEKIEVVHSFIPTHGITADPNGIRQKLDIPKDAFVVLGSGYETWRKGKDLFILLAAQVKKIQTERQVHFLWVGGWQREEDYRNALHDVEHLGLAGRVHFSGEVENPLDYFDAGDIFTMVSREDPFPLVCLEAAFLKKPVLCFADAGGMPEFVEKDAGSIVPYLDIAAMAEQVGVLANDHSLRKTLGENAATKVKKKYSVATGSEKIEKILLRKM